MLIASESEFPLHADEPSAETASVSGHSRGMTTTHERANPDISFRVRAPLTIQLADGARIAVQEWSLRAIHDPALAAHDLTDARLEIPFQGFEVGFPVRLQATQRPDEWLFEGLTGRQRETLALFHRNLLSGKMATTGEIITALDTPVDLVPMEETEDERRTSATAPARGLWKVIYYLGLFGLVFGVLGHFLWTRAEYLPLSNARYSAPLQQLAAPQAGFIRAISVPVGGAVKAGDLILQMEDPEATQALVDVRAAINRAELRRDQIARQLALHLQGQPKARAAAADPQRFDAGFSEVAGDFNDTRLKLEADLRAADLDLRGLRAERGRIRDAAMALEIRAPRDGLLDEVLVPLGSYQRIGTPLLTFENATSREVIGWLDESEAASVWPGMTAEVRYAVAGEIHSLDAVVTAIDASANPTAPDRFGMVVHLGLPELTPDAARALLPDNAPVEVALHRGTVQRWLGWGG